MLTFIAVNAGKVSAGQIEITPRRESNIGDKTSLFDVSQKSSTVLVMFFFNIIFFQELSYNIWSIYNHGGLTVGGFFCVRAYSKVQSGM